MIRLINRPHIKTFPASKYLNDVVEQSKSTSGIDNISLNQFFPKLTKMYLDAGDKKSAKETVNKMNNTFKSKKLNPTVSKTIDEEGKDLLKGK